MARNLTPEEYAQASELFGRVNGVDAERRADEIMRLPGYSPRAREEALSLLRQSPGGEFLRTPPVTPLSIDCLLSDAARGNPAAMVGGRIGRYEVRALLGVGGMGAVYRATDSATGEDVAVKVLRPHAMSRSAIARLEREARVLSRLNHPCVARVMQASTIPGADGEEETPYFAMELLDGGVPLDQWVRRTNPGARAVLMLMVRVCDAVHHGHQRGVIHRDLKPQNILVLPDGTPKLIDFGVAFATDADVSRITVSTGAGTLVGTFAYMSPEQCAGDPASIDTRSDVYALGVLLYETLTGRLPHSLDGLSIAESIGAIREGRVDRIDVVDPVFRGDIATIVHKAMHADPEQRYGSAADLAQDIARYLDARPIEARPAGLAYRLGLMWRRERAAVTAAAIAAVCVAGGATASILFGVRARAEERRAVAALDQEAAARARAERATTFLRGAIGSANPYQPRKINPALLSSEADPWAEWMFSPWDFAGVDGKKATVEDVLTAAAERLPTEFADDPITQADLGETLGVTLFRLERLEPARRLLERCVEFRLATLGEENDATIRAMLRLAEVCDGPDMTAALSWYRRAHARCVAKYGALDPRTLRAERMHAYAVTVSGGDGGSPLLETVGIPRDGERLAPARLFHAAFAAALLSPRGDPRARPIADRVLRRINAGDLDGDPFARVLSRRALLTVLCDAKVPHAELAHEIEAMRRDAEEVFGAWSPEYMNTMGVTMRPWLDNPEPIAVHAAWTARAQFRLRGQNHWETSNAIRNGIYSLGRVSLDSPTAAQTADSVVEALSEFPQGLSSPSVIAHCLLVRLDLRAGRTDQATQRMAGLLARMQAPQAPTLYPHAWARAHTVHGECLEALGRSDEARAEYEKAVGYAASFPHDEERARWTGDAAEHLQRPTPR